MFFMKILVGTNNENKLEQFKRIFKNAGLDIELLSLSEAGINDDVEEDADNLLGNAKKKAEYYAEKSGLITLADDTGLFIAALNGEPGVRSKRWHKGSEKERCLRILEKMEDVPQNKRSCSYKGVLAVYNPKTRKLWMHENDLPGMIANKLLEDKGFGYDPIFISTEFNKYYSQLSDEERDSISHRGKGVRELAKIINSL